MLFLRAQPRLQQPFKQYARRAYATAELSNGVKIAYDLHEPPKEAPQGNAPVVFLHGLFGSKKNNRSMSKVLARDLKRPVYAIDLRNHGDSSHHQRHDYTALAEDIEHFLGQEKMTDSTLIGHSMGAKTAMTVALRQRVPIASLISVDNAPIDAALKSDFAKYVRAMRRIEQAHVKRQADADAILAEYEDELPIRQFLLTNLYRAEDGTQKWRIPIKYLANALDNMADFPFKDPDEVRYAGPTLFVRGTKSHYVADEMLPTIGRFFPNFKLADVESGHWVISEEPEYFRKAVVEFLQEQE
ncbi:hypothetical protein B0A48_09390 [Cryoendolithus antarcticus]|uniref:AB hydrolase-1 domain-containing protein n=1 Tax=Cryoendolithus antarcticus TaxID=1507870 RepID=A0A1V8SZS8_9PEZI|nr:hypothetical protein B0A48_09390 [Cryoendolithus antarcticus]